MLEHITLYLGLIDELQSRLTYVLETHVHEDHATPAHACAPVAAPRWFTAVLSGVRWADLLVSDGDTVALGQERIDVRATPGHTRGCVSYLWRDRLFSGDALLIGGCGRTDLPDSNAGQLYDSRDGGAS
ncbi:MAG: MBL fold metallo-hydrolase [Comamonadaceae bacterium]|nr:MBL fold metallo-hydrolase [Comamonadaceae bacterium]